MQDAAVALFLASQNEAYNHDDAHIMHIGYVQICLKCTGFVAASNLDEHTIWCIHALNR